MRGEDWDMGILLRDHWTGKRAKTTEMCPLLSDLNAMLAYLEEIGLRPGDAILACPACGNHHRWTLLKELIIHALHLRPESRTSLMTTVNEDQDEVRRLYGGEEAYESMRKDAEAFFARVQAKNRYVP